MRFDDRLLTVLNQPVTGQHDRAVRWRQLLELVARGSAVGGSDLIAEAMTRIRNDASEVDEHVRAAAGRAIAPLELPIELLRFFASEPLAVSAPVLAAASLDRQDWQALHAAASDESRRFIESLHPELKPQPEPARAPQATSATPGQQPSAGEAQRHPAAEPRQQRSSEPRQRTSPTGQGDRYVPPSLHELVVRIEQRQRKLRPDQAKPQPKVEETALFRWECGPSGEIQWVEGAPRGALIGRSLAQPQLGEGHRPDPEIARAFNLRAPFRDARLTFPDAGVLTGDWKMSGVPAFEPIDGRFAGFRGIAMRDARSPRSSLDIAADPDALRELVHEVRTPLNAIIGFAEIIDTQLLGPADESYRERAADIVAQARLLLNAISDLDLVGRIRATASSEEQPVADLGAVIDGLIPSLREIGEERDVPLDGARAIRDLTVSVEPDLAERLILRLWRSLVRFAEPGEQLRLSVEQRPNSIAVAITRPAALADAHEDQLFGDGPAGPQNLELRLLRGLTAIAGGTLTAPHGSLSLIFPRP